MYKILIAEDEIWISALIRSIIQKGCPDTQIVGEALNGRKALEMIGALQPDIVLADINMPVLSGLQMIETSKKSGYKSKFIIISGYKDFSYVQQALRIGVEDYLLKPIDDNKLCSVIAHVIQKIESEASVSQRSSLNDSLLKAQFLSRLLINKSLSLSSSNEAFGLSFAPGQFQCAVIKFVHRSLDHSYLIANSLTGITARFRAAFAEQLKLLCSEAFMISQGSYLLLFLNYPQEQTALVKDVLTALFDQLLSDCAENSIYIAMGLSDICSDFSLLSTAYRQAQHAAASRMSVGMGKIIRFVPDGRKRNDPLSPLTLSDHDRMVLNRALYSSLPDDLVSWFNRLFDDYVQRNNIIETETLLMLDISATLLTAFLDAVDALPFQVALNRSAFLEQLDVFPTVQKLRAHVGTLLQTAKSRINKQRDATDMTITRVTEYINKHLSEAITLDEVARAVYLTPSYLSEYFKVKTGTNFKDYVLSRRMERGSELLRQKNSGRIQDVALQCGYADFKHFCRVFKKYTGVTPTEFRRIYG